MIDYNLFKSLLADTKSGYIEPFDELTNELIQLFEESPLSKVKTLFKAIESRQEYYYTCHFICDKCGKEVVLKLHKTALFELLNRKSKKRSKDVLCKKCKTEKEEIEKAERAFLYESPEEKFERYKSLYLSTGMAWDKDVSTWTKINQIKQASGDIIEMIKCSILKMSYKDFLKTPYWKAVSEHARNKAKYKCQMCGKQGELHVHHRNYANHGAEVYHMEDLICLCSDCHSKFHNK